MLTFSANLLLLTSLLFLFSCPYAPPLTVAPNTTLFSLCFTAGAVTPCQGQSLRLLSAFFSLYVCVGVPCLGSFFSPEHVKSAVLQRRAARISKVGTQEGGGAAGRICQNRTGNKILNSQQRAVLSANKSFAVLRKKYPF